MDYTDPLPEPLRPFDTTSQTKPPATEAGAANMNSTLHPKPNPTEFKSFETIFVPAAPSSCEKLNLQFGQATTEAMLNTPNSRAPTR